MANRVISQDERRTLSYSEASLAGLKSSASRSQGLLVVSESGLYKLVMRSDKPEARKFQDWVTREVLPSIRKDGGYILGQEDMTPDQFIRALAKFAGRKVRASPHEGKLWMALLDLIAPIRPTDNPEAARRVRAKLDRTTAARAVGKRKGPRSQSP